MIQVVEKGFVFNEKVVFVADGSEGVYACSESEGHHKVAIKNGNRIVGHRIVLAEEIRPVKENLVFYRRGVGELERKFRHPSATPL